MNKTTSQKNKPIILPNGEFCARFQCSDCVFYDTRDYDKYGECYCKIKGRYMPADDYTCNDFVWKK